MKRQVPADVGERFHDSNFTRKLPVLFDAGEPDDAHDSLRRDSYPRNNSETLQFIIIICHLSQFQSRLGDIAMRKVLVSMLLLASICSGAIGQDRQAARATQSSGASPELTKFIETETSMLGQFHLRPIIIPQGERVGDIIDETNGTLIAGADDCFPGLKPRETPSQLPVIEIASEKELAAALGAAASADVSGEVRSGRTFLLDFQDVRVERVSLFQLRNALRKNAPECNSIRPFIDATYPSGSLLLKGAKADKLLVGIRKVIGADRAPPLLVEKVVYARRVVHIRTAQTLAGGAKISFGAQLLKRLGLGSFIEASGTAGDNSTNVVDLVGTDSIPVAFARAFVIISTKKLANGQVEYDIASVNEDSVEKKIRFARQVASQRLAKLDEIQRNESACAHDKQKLDAIDVSAAGARQQYVEFQAQLACPSLRAEIKGIIKKIDLRVKEAQTELARLGCYNASINGKFDEATKKSLALYNTKKGSSADGDHLTGDFISELKQQNLGLCPPDRPGTRVVETPPRSRGQSAARQEEPVAGPPRHGIKRAVREEEPAAPRSHSRPHPSSFATIKPKSPPSPTAAARTNGKAPVGVGF